MPNNETTQEGKALVTEGGHNRRGTKALLKGERLRTGGQQKI